MDDMDVIYKGIRLSNYCRVLKIHRDVLPSRDNVTIDIPGREGTYFYRKKVNPRTFSVDILISEPLEENRQALANVLESDSLVPIEFSDHPGIVYDGIFTGQSEISKINNQYGTTTLEFFIPYPYGKGESYIAHIPAGTNVQDISVYSGVETFPVITATFLEDTPAFAIACGEKYLQLGHFQTVSTTPVPKEQLIFFDSCESLTGWTALNGTFEEISLTGQINSNGYSFSLLNSGEGSAWHGAALAKGLSEPVQDFVFQAKVINRSTGSNLEKQMGKIDIYFRNTAGESIAKLTLKDDSPVAYLNNAQAGLGYYGRREIIFDRKVKNLNDFDGLIRMRREGNAINVYFGQIRKGKEEWSTATRIIDAKGLFTDKIASIVVALSVHGTSPASTMYIEDLKLWKINQLDEDTNVDQVFHAGDVLTIDMEKGSIYLNSVNAIKYMVPGSQFFGLQPGTETIGVIPAGAVEVDIQYDSRYL
jgi:predicted phage tail component-like protein